MCQVIIVNWLEVKFSEFFFNVVLKQAGLIQEYYSNLQFSRDGHSKLTNEQKRELAENELRGQNNIHRVTDQDHRIYRVLKKLCEDLGEEMPSLYIDKKETQLAGQFFAFNMWNRAIVANEYGLERITDDEIRGVLAHEMKHFNQTHEAYYQKLYYEAAIKKIVKEDAKSLLFAAGVSVLAASSGKASELSVVIAWSAIALATINTYSYLVRKKDAEILPNEDEADRALAEAIPRSSVQSFVEKCKVFRKEEVEHWRFKIKGFPVISSSPLLQAVIDKAVNFIEHHIKTKDSEHSGENKRYQQMLEHAIKVESKNIGSSGINGI